MNTDGPGTTNRPLPPGWRWVRLGDVAEFLDSQRKPINEFERRERIAGRAASELYPYYGANGQVGVIDGYIFDEPLVLLAEDGGAFGSATSPIAYRVNGKCWVNNHAHVIRAKEGICLDFLYRSLWIRPDIGWLVSGNTRPKLNQEVASRIPIPLPPLPEQRRIAAILNEQMAAVDKARSAAKAQLKAAEALTEAVLAQSLRAGSLSQRLLGDCLVEVTDGVGSDWHRYRLLGATRNGTAPAKEGFGKAPERYKRVDPGTIFYNPMRILLGSIAMLDDGDTPGVTSPDYVVFRARQNEIHPRWFYAWLRSSAGAAFIKSLARGAVRERIMFRRLANAKLETPLWKHQEAAALCLRGIEIVRRHVGNQIETINALPPALLRQAFSGAL